MIRSSLLALTLLVLFTSVSDAFIFRRFRARRYNYSGNSTGVAYYNHSAISGDAQAVAEYKANWQAENLTMAHIGGGYGGANAEGVGMGPTAASALNNCCFTGQRVVAGQAVVQGSNGYFYACKLFW